MSALMSLSAMMRSVTVMFLPAPRVRVLRSKPASMGTPTATIASSLMVSSPLPVLVTTSSAV